MAWLGLFWSWSIFTLFHWNLILYRRRRPECEPGSDSCPELRWKTQILYVWRRIYYLLVCHWLAVSYLNTHTRFPQDLLRDQASVKVKPLNSQETQLSPSWTSTSTSSNPSLSLSRMKRCRRSWARLHGSFGLRWVWHNCIKRTGLILQIVGCRLENRHRHPLHPLHHHPLHHRPHHRLPGRPSSSRSAHLQSPRRFSQRSWRWRWWRLRRSFIRLRGSFNRLRSSLLRIRRPFPWSRT